MTAGNMIFLYFRKLKPLGFFKCLLWTKTMKTFSIYPGAIWSSCFVRLGRLGLRCPNFHLSGRSLDLEQNAICPRLAAEQRNSHHELVSLKMSSFKLVILWGALKIRNLRLSPKERGSGTSGRCIFFAHPYRGTGVQADLHTHGDSRRAPRSHSPSSLREALGEKQSLMIYRVRQLLYNRPSLSSSLKSYTCAFSLWEWASLFHRLYQQVFQKLLVSVFSYFTPCFFTWLGLQVHKHLGILK